MQEIVADFQDGASLVEPDGAFEVEVEAAVVEVDGANDGSGIVGDEGFGVEEAGGVFVDLDAVAQKGGIIGAGDGEDVPFIGNMGHSDADVDAALGGGAERSGELVIQDEVGGIDVDVLGGVVDDLEIDVFGNGLGVQRAVRVGQHVAVAGKIIGMVDMRQVRHVVLVAGAVFGEVVPEGEEHDGEAPDGFTLQPNASIFPMAVFFVGVDVFVSQVDAAGIGDLTVDDQDLAVVAVVEAGGEDGDEGIEGPALDA